MEVRNADEQDDFIGLAFNYQSNQRFMLVTWKKAREVYRDRNPFTATAEPELQVKRIRTRRSKGPYLRNSIWQSAPVFFTSTPLWRKTGGWEEGVKYRWNLRYSSASGCMNLRIEGFDGVAETGCMCDYYSRGGKMGLFTFGQPNIIWSDIKIRQLPGESTHTHIPPILISNCLAPAVRMFVYDIVMTISSPLQITRLWTCSHAAMNSVQTTETNHDWLNDINSLNYGKFLVFEAQSHHLFVQSLSLCWNCFYLHHCAHYISIYIMYVWLNKRATVMYLICFYVLMLCIFHPYHLVNNICLQHQQKNLIFLPIAWSFCYTSLAWLYMHVHTIRTYLWMNIHKMWNYSTTSALAAA